MDQITNAGAIAAATKISIDFLETMFGTSETGRFFVGSRPNDEAAGIESPHEVKFIPAPHNAGELPEFLEKWDRAGRAMFFCTGILMDDATKRRKELIKESCFLHVDIDLNKIDLIGSVDELVNKLRGLRCPPSVIVATGHGVHAYWIFNDPVSFDEQARVEAALKLLADLLGGDREPTHVAAFLRLPGSHNTKNGEWTEVAVAENNRHRYELSDLEDWLFETSIVILRKTRERSRTVGETDFFAEYGNANSYKPPIDVKARLDAMGYGYGGDANIHKTQVSVTASMLNAGVPVEEVVSLVKAATEAAAGEYHSTWDWRREEKAIRGMCDTWQAKRAKETTDEKAKASKTAPADDIDPVDSHDENDIKRLNSIHAVLPIGGKVRVVTFGELEEFPGRETIVMTQSISDFAALQNKYRHKYIDKKGEVQSVPMGGYWIASQFRRQYDGGMAFMPKYNKGSVGNKLNLWRGYGVDAVKPDGRSGADGCDKFLEFMLNVMCSGNVKDFDYLRKREAVILQQRIRTEVALAWRSDEEGVGKGFYEKTMGHLLGVHAMQVGNPKHVIGAFNPHLESLLRLTADEALFVGNPEHRNSLFGLITEPKLTIEPKHCGVYRADSFLNLSITSNAKHFVPISGTARRFFIPTISPARIQDHAYFAEIQKQLDEGGFEALLYYFLHEVDLTDFNVRLVPKTQGLMEQRNHSLPPLDAWWVELLESGTIAGSNPHAPYKAVSNEYQREIEIDLLNGTTQSRYVRQLGIYDQARQIEPRLRGYGSDHRLGSYLSEMGCTNKQKVLRHRGWTFPALMACREAWEKRYPGWPWRDTDIVEWRAEEQDDETPDETASRDRHRQQAEIDRHRNTEDADEAEDNLAARYVNQRWNTK